MNWMRQSRASLFTGADQKPSARISRMCGWKRLLLSARILDGGGLLTVTNPRGRHDLLTLAAVGVVAHVCADVSHEVLGHGVVCLLTGGKMTLLTSVFFRTEPLSRLVAAAGPCANLITGRAGLRIPKSSLTKHLFISRKSDFAREKPRFSAQ